MPTPPGMLTFSSAWQILRHRDLTNPEYELLWTKGLSFKISFFLWRLQKGKIPTDDLWRRNGYLTVSKYWCCLPPQEETFQYIFLTSSIASRVWKMFLQAAGVVVNPVKFIKLIGHDGMLIVVLSSGYCSKHLQLLSLGNFGRGGTL